jgi:iron(II)-dependent oxidoreductase
VVSASWYDAQAFCAWLTERWRDDLPAGWAVMLPSEAEWEKAARGGARVPAVARVVTVKQGAWSVPHDGAENPLPQRAYPWGGAWAEGNANTSGNVGHASTPGCFESGRSPYGCDDMAGNVWEWTRSLWGEDIGAPEFAYPYDPRDRERERVDAGPNIWRVVRGGSWNHDRGFARCAYRLWVRPDLRFFPLGFRVVLRASPCFVAPIFAASDL